MNKQQGFTLIELIVVIVILGILAATALPRFVDLSADARQAAVEGVAGGLASGSAINYAASAVGNATAITVQSGVSSCNTVAGTLIQGGIPTGFTVTGTVPTCTVGRTDGAETAVATLVVTQ